MSISSFDDHQFISKIVQDSDTGYSFVPFVGSGLSSASGIIMGIEFTNYLAFTTYLVLCDPKKRERTHGEGIPSHWDLRRQGWPPQPSNKEIEKATEWLTAEFESICERYELTINWDKGSHFIRSLAPKHVKPPTHELLASLAHPQIPSLLAASDARRPEERVKRIADWITHMRGRGSVSRSTIDLILSDTSRSYRQRIVEIGVRALHDWRETLEFLASVAIIDGYPTLAPPHNSVIDRFNSVITQDKYPNLGHKMLAHLAGPLRIHSVLTTNFDTLIEDAFRLLNYRIRVLPVSSKGHLPDAQTVGSDLALVKLHGEVHDTRADLTLDDEPSDEDKEIFSAYLTRGAGNLRDSTFLQLPESKRLLVVGYGGADPRCVQLIKSWLEQPQGRAVGDTDRHSRRIVYWICYSNSDVKRISRLFSAPDYDNQVRITRTSRPDLLLYQLYQRLVLSLPPGGLTYEFAHALPPGRWRAFDHDDALISSVQSCADTAEHPLEAARIVLAESYTAAKARNLWRDAITKHLKELILDVIRKDDIFLDSGGRYRPVKYGPCIAEQWQPLYKNQHSDPEHAPREGSKSPVLLDSPGGVVRAAALAVDELTATTSKKVFWLETQDYMDADSMLRDFFRTLAVRHGSFQGRHVTQHPLSQLLRDSLSPPLGGGAMTPSDADKISECISEHIKRLFEDTRIDADNIVLLIYGRDSYGGCAGLLSSPWNEDHFYALHCIIDAFGKAGIRTLYFPLLRTRALRKSQFPDSPLANSDKLGIQRPLDWHLESKSHDFTNWDAHCNTVDSWRDWPHDHIADAQLLPNLSPERETSILHTAESVSVFRTLIDDILKPFNVLPQSIIQKNSVEYRRIVFLYAITLFRHSRHLNALCSEAAFHCPFRFNCNSIDNDVIRAEEAKLWIDQLRSGKVFFDKPGGSVWMHRDIRLTLQHLLERVDLHYGHKASGETRPGNRFLLEMRSRIHFWIGDWYNKAFCSCGHLTPIVEAVHQRLMAAMYSPFAKFKASASGSSRRLSAAKQEELREYQITLFETAVIEAQKTLHLAWKEIMLWQSSALEVSWIGTEHRERIHTALHDIVDRLTPEKRERDRLRIITDSFSHTLSSLSNEIQLEGGREHRHIVSMVSPLNSGLSAFRYSGSPFEHPIQDTHATQE
ncbi:SIR2 family protein [Rubinisphaera margarita]|uniref:SIR2 family protein n=1 Tax=Rubinisphaera margarita TaxID=2909586 RepID=UPI001EE7A4E0|nr:SIR2 family protein [Rubinisphaera margarita]MCG6157644.1 SIR2 family protein [Rubinisphaera margarita]